MAKFIELTEITEVPLCGGTDVKNKVKVNVDNIICYKGHHVFLKDSTSLLVDEEYDQITKLIEQPIQIGVIHEAADNLVNEDWQSRKVERQQAAINQFPHWAERRVGFIAGAEWGDKTMLDKACEWIRDFMEYSNLFEYQNSEETIQETIKDFRKAMKE